MLQSRSGTTISGVRASSTFEPNGSGSHISQSRKTVNEIRSALGRGTAVFYAKAMLNCLDYKSLRVGWTVSIGRRNLIGASLVVALGAIPAHGQSAPSRDRDPSIAAQHTLANELQTSTFHHGAFYLRSRLELSDIGVDPDFADPGVVQTGLSFGLQAPQQLYYVPTKKVIFGARVTPIYSFYQRDGVHSQGGYQLRADAHFLLNHAYLDFFHSQADSLRSNAGEFNSVYTAHQVITGLNSELKYSSRTSLTFSGSDESLTYPTSKVQPEAIPVSLLDMRAHGGRVALRHKTFPLTSLSVIGDLRRYTFENAPVKDSRREFVGAGAAFDNGRNTVSMEIGQGRLKFTTPGVRSFSGWLGSISVARRLQARLNLQGVAMRDTAFSVYGPNNYYVVDQASLGLAYSATRRLSLTATTQYGRDSYDLPFEGVLREDRFTYSSVGWLYSLRRLHAGFDIGYFRRTSNAPSVAPASGIRTVVHLSLIP
jgi:hypothetical protein